MTKRIENATPPSSKKTSQGAIAQLGEHLLCKQGVVGSIPTGSTTFSLLFVVKALVYESTRRTFTPRSAKKTYLIMIKI